MSIKVLSRSARKEVRVEPAQGCLLKMGGRSARQECSRHTEKQWSDSEFNINSWWALGSFSPQMAALLLQHFSFLSTSFLFCPLSSPAGYRCNWLSDGSKYCAVLLKLIRVPACTSVSPHMWFIDFIMMTFRWTQEGTSWNYILLHIIKTHLSLQ